MKNNKMDLKKYRAILETTIIAIIVYLLHKLFFFLNNNNHDFQNFYYPIEIIYGFFLSCSVVILFILIKVKAKDIDNVGHTFLLVTCIKMVIAYVVLLPILNSVSQNAGIEKMNFLRFKEFWKMIRMDFECINTENMEEAYNLYLLKSIAIRFAEEPEFVITPYFFPKRRAIFFSNRWTKGPATSFIGSARTRLTARISGVPYIVAAYAIRFIRRFYWKIIFFQLIERPPSIVIIEPTIL